MKQVNSYEATGDDAYKLNAAKLEADGYDGVKLPVKDGNIYMVLDPEQIKSADPVTYDEQGNVIPLSQRFDPSNSDIRYSDRDANATYAEIEEERQKLFQRERDLLARKREAENNAELLQAMDDYSALFDEARSLFSKRRQGTATQKEMDRIEEIKALREERLNRVSELQESLGLPAMEKEAYEIRAEKEALRIASDEAWAREGAEKENKAIEKAGVSAAEYFRKKALKAFKTTTNFNEAGYMLPDGKLLNFSGGERNHRYRDHREIGEIYEATQGVAALNRFLRDGNIRIMAESPGIDLAAGVEPTKEQYAALRRFINTNGVNDGQFFVDFSNTDGSRAGNYSYQGRVFADRIINDIKYFYENGSVREQSSVASFLYSERDMDAQKVNQVLEKENGRLREDVTYLKELLKLQKQVTGGTKFTKTSVEAAAGQLMKKAGAKGDRKELAKLLNSLYEHIAGGEELTWESVKDAAQPAVDWLQSHVATKERRSEYAEEVLREIRGSRIALDELQKKEVAYQYGSYNEFRKKCMGSVIVTDQAGISLDSQWHEWASLYPNLFDEEISSNDMPSALLDVFDRLRSMTDGDVYGYDQALFEQDLLGQVYDSYWNVSTLYTVADKYQKEITRLKLEHTGRMKELREYHAEKVAKLKQEHRQALEKVKQADRERLEKALQQTRERYQQSKERNAESRKKAEMRRKIRKTIMDLGKLLNKGDKKRNVKEGMKDFVSKALVSAEVLFMDNYSNEDMVRYGVQTELTEQEEKYMTEAKALLEQLYVLPSGSFEAYQQRQEREAKLKSQIAYRMGKLQDVFARERARLNKVQINQVLGDLADAYAKLQQDESGAYQENVYQFLLLLSKKNAGRNGQGHEPLSAGGAAQGLHHGAVGCAQCQQDVRAEPQQDP